ncbi:hypothetical protein ACQEVF_15495 [Nonomuraea polychroma]|uniref:hypothetical protein n=1 Tax=Nonomuraea polychroma TaxID=46176 RepID=UPI003D8FBD46
MTEVIPAERMPATVRAARVIMTLQLGFSLFLSALLLPGAAAAFTDPLLLVVLLQLLLIVVLMGWLVFRWSSRRKWVRWCAIAFEAFAVSTHLITTTIDGELSWRTLIDLGTILPLAIVITLLTPAAARWFNR